MFYVLSGNDVLSGPYVSRHKAEQVSDERGNSHVEWLDED